MARQRNPNRDEAFRLYRTRRGKITPKEIAATLKISPKLVREWKCRDKWDEQLHKRGAPQGNKNAVGNNGGAPKGNTNAETHGAYSYPRTEQWSEEDKAKIENTLVQFDSLAESQMKSLLAKQHDLERRISELSDDDETDQLYLDRVMTMTMPVGGKMEYRSESSTFSRRMILEAELNRVHGRVQKLIDSIRAREDQNARMNFEREKFEFSKQKTLGEFLVGSADSDEAAAVSVPDEKEEIIE
jgi:uncharacterized protein YjcR